MGTAGPDPADLDRVAAAIPSAPTGGRTLVAVAGPPASGKSTFAEALAAHVTAAGRAAQVVPMDGFHLDDRILRARGLLPRKGAPETFDAAGLVRLVAALGQGGEVVHPVFDRASETAIAGAGVVPAACDLAIVEGNYLLLDEDPWRDLAERWSLTVFLDVPEGELRRRLIARWRGAGLDDDAARAKADGNDIPNGLRVAAGARRADIAIAAKGRSG